MYTYNRIMKFGLKMPPVAHDYMCLCGTSLCSWNIQSSSCLAALASCIPSKLEHLQLTLWWILWLVAVCRKHIDVSLLKASPQVMAHFVLVEVVLTRGLAKRQHNCNCKQATFIGPCLHLNTHEFQVDGGRLCMNKSSNLELSRMSLPRDTYCRTHVDLGGRCQWLKWLASDPVGCAELERTL